MGSHPREPIKHTCPDINKIQKCISTSIKNARYRDGDSEKDYQYIIDDLVSTMEDCYNVFEELRNSNHHLREWGIEEATNVDAIEEKLYSNENPELIK